MVKPAKDFLDRRTVWGKVWWQKCAFYAPGLRYKGNGHEMTRERVGNRGQGACAPPPPPLAPSGSALAIAGSQMPFAS